MGRRSVEQHHIRSLTKNNGGAYSVTLPIEFVRSLSWQERQKLVVKRKGKQLVIEDWSK